LKTSSLREYAEQLACQTVQFRDSVILSDALGSKKKSKPIELLRIIMPQLPSQPEQKSLASVYSMASVSFFVNVAFFAKKRTKWKDVQRFLADLIAFHKPVRGDVEISLLFRILQSMISQILPRNLTESIIRLADTLDKTPDDEAESCWNMNGYYRVLPFLELYWASYDSKMKKDIGVFFTPYPVVSFIIRSLHSVLIEKLEKPLGLADKSITLIDPAAGTSTFMITAAKKVLEEFRGYPDSALNLLGRFHNVEIALPLYILSFLNAAHLLKSLNIPIRDENELNVCLGDTLKEEAERNYNVIIGNPPYAGYSSTNNPLILKKLRDYFPSTGNKGGQTERNLKWLYADYVKFIRFAQLQIDRQKEGVVCYVTNNGYLDNATFRQMRRSLLNSFDEIFILNLCGNAMKRFNQGSDEKDENVFDIRQGVAIVFFIKKRIREKGCKVYYSELRGTRTSKFFFLNSNEINTIKWSRIFPISLYSKADSPITIIYNLTPHRYKNNIITYLLYFKFLKYCFTA